MNDMNSPCFPMFVAVDHFPMLHPRFDADSVPGIATALDSSWDQHWSCLENGKLVLGIAFQMVIPKITHFYGWYTPSPNGRFINGFIIGFPTLYRIHYLSHGGTPSSHPF